MRLALSALVAFMPAAALACSCGQDEGPPQQQVALARSRADAVFVGKVIELRIKPTPPYSSSLLLAVFEVSESFKGRVGPLVVMPSGGNSSDCSYGFESGKTYLVYAYSSGGVLSTDSCTRTTVLGPKHEQELAWLRLKPTLETPLALRRSAPVCSPCDAALVASGLISGRADGGLVAAASEEEASTARTTRRPFWFAPFRDGGVASSRVVVGIGRDGKAFELEQSPWTATTEACWQSVWKRSCGALSADFECLNPTGLKKLCDELKGRKHSVGPKEPLGSCPAPGLDHDVCMLRPQAEPLADAGSTGVVVSCRPLYEAGDAGRSQCAVVFED